MNLNILNNKKSIAINNVILNCDYDTNNYDGIKQISALDFLLGRNEL